MQEHGSTIDGMHKRDQITAAPTKYKLSPRVQLCVPFGTDFHGVTEVSHCTQLVRDPAHGRFRTNPQWLFKQLICTITNWAMDKLGLVTKLVHIRGPIFPFSFVVTVKVGLLILKSAEGPFSGGKVSVSVVCIGVCQLCVEGVFCAVSLGSVRVAVQKTFFAAIHASSLRIPGSTRLGRHPTAVRRCVVHAASFSMA